MKNNNLSVILIFASIFLSSAVFAADKPPRITHEPVKAGVKGQPVYIRATVFDDAGPAKEVNLYCAVSSDSAPFKVKMKASGAGSFIGTIPDNMVANSSEVSYYIEAIDSIDQAAETPWYNIKFTSTASGTATASKQDTEQPSSWKKPVLIGLGAAAVVGAGVAIAGGGSSGGSSDDSSGGDDEPEGGTYSGSATRYFQLTGAVITSETYAVTFNMPNSTTITTETLHPGARMEAAVSLNVFTMSGPVTENGTTGQVLYSGTIAGTKITGTISGNVVTSGGTNGVYSGIFSADKQP